MFFISIMEIFTRQFSDLIGVILKTPKPMCFRKQIGFVTVSLLWLTTRVKCIKIIHKRMNGKR